MGKVTGFLEIDRQDRCYERASDRIGIGANSTSVVGGGDRDPARAA